MVIKIIVGIIIMIYVSFVVAVLLAFGMSIYEFFFKDIKRNYEKCDKTLFKQ
jgi:hypothetical protein